MEIKPRSTRSYPSFTTNCAAWPAGTCETARRAHAAKYERHEALGRDVAAVYGGLGDKDHAFAWLEKDFQARSGLLGRIKWELPFESLHSVLAPPLLGQSHASLEIDGYSLNQSINHEP